MNTLSAATVPEPGPATQEPELSDEPDLPADDGELGRSSEPGRPERPLRDVELE